MSVTTHEQLIQRVEDIHKQLGDLKTTDDNREQRLQALEQRLIAIEERLDYGHSMDLARDFTAHEIKNICVKAFAQGVSFFLANILLGIIWERCVPRVDAKK